MADPTGFLQHRERELPARRPVAVRITDFREVYAQRGADESFIPALRRQATRCMDCGIPFCHHGCPLGNLIPEWNDLVRRGEWRKAADRLHATNNFPDFTGRLCPAPCETSCVLGINQDPVTIKSVEQAIIDKAFDDGNVPPSIPAFHTDKTVAVIGSGPAGLAAAQQLTRAGHTVAVLERADAIGGLLRYGIPEFKLEKAHLEARLDQMRAEGTIFYPNTPVGGVDPGAVQVADLRERYDAVVIAAGSTIPRDLPIPGRDLGGIHQAMDYLPQATRVVHAQTVENQIVATDKDVVIIGGGDTGADCLGTAIRQGARHITQLEILPQPGTDRPAHQPWPTYPMLLRTSSAHEEGGERVYSTLTGEFVSDGSAGEGQVTHLRVSEVDMSSGRPVSDESTERLIPAQLVLLAMGFVGVPSEGMVNEFGITLDERGRIERDEAFATSADGVFVAGDAGRGQSLIVWAIAEGRACAAAVDTYLRGSTELPAPIAPSTMSIGL